MIKVFDSQQCLEIYNSTKPEQIQFAKNLFIDFLQSNDIILTDINLLKDMIHTSSTNASKNWHYDDNSLINFIINIKGEGTKILIDNEIIQIPQGYGYFIIGEEGYKFLGLKPVLHSAPDTNNDRKLLKIMLNANFNLSNYLLGSSVCSYNSDKYNNRSLELEKNASS